MWEAGQRTSDRDERCGLATVALGASGGMKPDAGADSSATSGAAQAGAVGVRSQRRFQTKSDRPLPPPFTRQMRRRASELIAMLTSMSTSPSSTRAERYRS